MLIYIGGNNRPQLIRFSSKYQGLGRPNLQFVSKARVWNLNYTVFDTGTLDGFNRSSQLLVASLSYVFQFHVAHVIVRLRKQFLNNLTFPTWAVRLALIIMIIIIITIIMIIIIEVYSPKLLEPVSPILTTCQYAVQEIVNSCINFTVFSFVMVSNNKNVCAIL